MGQGAWEEIDWQSASSPGGENYGWRRMEGLHCYDPASGCLTPSLTLPIVEYAHTANPQRCSVTGGVVSRGASVPEIAGRYLFADYCSGEIFSVRRLGNEAIDARNHRAEWVPAGGRSIGSVTDLGEDARGDVYVTDSAGGEVFRLTTTTPSAMRLVPIVLDATGRGESRFSTELVVANRGASTATIRAVYTPAALFGGAGGGTVSELIGRGQQKSWPDALAWLRFKGLAIPDASQGSQGGTLRVELTGLVSAADGVVLARTTTPSGSGRAGLAYPAPRAQDLVAETAVLYGLRETASDRTNLALLSGATSGVTTLRVTLFSGGRTFVLPETVRLEPGEWVQLDSVLARAGFASGWAVVERLSGPGPFWAYAVFNDNGTSDGSYVAPVPAGAIRRDPGRSRGRRDRRLRERARPGEPRGLLRHGAPPLGRVARRRLAAPVRGGRSARSGGAEDPPRFRRPAAGEGPSGRGPRRLVRRGALRDVRERLGTRGPGVRRGEDGLAGRAAAAPTGSSPRARAWTTAPSARRGSSACGRTTP